MGNGIIRRAERRLDNADAPSSESSAGINRNTATKTAPPKRGRFELPDSPDQGPDRLIGYRSQVRPCSAQPEGPSVFRTLM